MNLRILPLKVRDELDAQREFKDLGVSIEGIKILSSKSSFLFFTIEGIRSWEANIIKQSLLSVGADAAIERDALLKNKETRIIVFGSLRQLEALRDKLSVQPFRLKAVAQELAICLKTSLSERYVFTARDKKLTIDRPIICGIINLTVDSFSGDGLLATTNSTKALQSAVLEKVSAMVASGAKIIDIGAESSRPYAPAISQKQEVSRLIPVVRALRKEFKRTPLSVDTHKHAVARACVDEGIDIINDITALRQKPSMVDLIARFRLGCVLMHMKGTPLTMQIKPSYKDIMGDLNSFFKQRLTVAYQAGIKPTQLLIDPGIGFGKRLEDNLTILNKLYQLKVFGLPIFVGLSKKSFIGKILSLDPVDRLFGSIGAQFAAIGQGANIIRVHDVKEMSQALKVWQRIRAH